MKKLILAIVASFAFTSVSSIASQAGNFEVGVYGGVGVNFDSDVSSSLTNGDVNDVEWDGDSFGPAPYWGARVTYWPATMPRWGFMLDYTHAKMKADAASMSQGAYTRLEFTDGLNLVTANAVYKLNEIGRFKPYAGAGVGLSIPHVEVSSTDDAAATTMEYQVTGVALQALAGAKVDLGRNFALFSEYKLSYAQIDADLNGGHTLETDAWTNHFVLGLSYKFGDR